MQILRDLPSAFMFVGVSWLLAQGSIRPHLLSVVADEVFIQVRTVAGITGGETQPAELDRVCHTDPVSRPR